MTIRRSILLLLKEAVAIRIYIELIPRRRTFIRAAFLPARRSISPETPIEEQIIRIFFSSDRILHQMPDFQLSAGLSVWRIPRSPLSFCTVPYRARAMRMTLRFSASYRKRCGSFYVKLADKPPCLDSDDVPKQMAGDPA